MGEVKLNSKENSNDLVHQNQGPLELTIGKILVTRTHS